MIVWVSLSVHRERQRGGERERGEARASQTDRQRQIKSRERHTK